MKPCFRAAAAAILSMSALAHSAQIPLSALTRRDVSLAAGAMASPFAAQAGSLLVVDGAAQRLVLWQGGEAKFACDGSTALAGFGCDADSGRTPVGWHRVAQWIGGAAAPGQVFVSRVATSEVIPPEGWRSSSGEDKVLTRIMWLEGLEPGRNSGPGVDSHGRYIYIHGTNQEHLLGAPASHGCIRLANYDAMALFDLTCGTETRCVVIP